jgi:hypothetical protein
MVKWLSCRGEDIAEADDIRWTDVAWKPRTRGVKIGEHDIEGKVESCDREWVHVRVKSCQTRPDAGWTVESFKKGDLLRRRRVTLHRGSVQRMTWTDESVRGIVTSKHFRAETSAPETPTAAPRAAQSHRRSGGGRRGYQRKGRRKTQLKP